MSYTYDNKGMFGAHVTKGARMHTPTPWRLSDNGSIWGKDEIYVADIAEQSDGAYIVQCVNSHTALVEALEIAKDGFERLCKRDNIESCGELLAINKALKRAKGDT